MSKFVRQLTIDEVAQIPFFNDLLDEHLKLFSEILEVHYFGNNTYIIKEGDNQDSMFFILMGSVKILKNTEDGEQQVLTTLEAPQIFGEMSLISEGKRSANVVSTSDIIAAKLKSSDFEKLIDKDPKLAVNILRKAASAICLRLRRANLCLAKAVQQNESY